MAFLFSHSWVGKAEACELCIAAMKMAKEKEASGKEPPLRFSTLMTWDYRPGGQPSTPVENQGIGRPHRSFNRIRVSYAGGKVHSKILPLANNQDSLQWAKTPV